MDNHVCFCLWDDLEQSLTHRCPECTKRDASQMSPWDSTWPIVPTFKPIDHANSGCHGGGTLPRRRCAEHNMFSCVPCTLVEDAEYARTITPPDVLHQSLNSQEEAVHEKGRLHRTIWLYRRTRLWRQVPQNATYPQGCALVFAGLLHIIGAFFYECRVQAIRINRQSPENVIRLGSAFTTKASLQKYQRQMVDNEGYVVRVLEFGQSSDLHRRFTSRQFDYVSLSEMPFMATAVRHLLLYLGSGRDHHSSYHIYHDSILRGEGRDEPRKHQILFGMVRFPWSLVLRTATTARMINIMPNNTVPTPALDKGPASWRRFCDSNFKGKWEEIRMRDFRYETYKVEEERRFRPRLPSPSRTPPGSPPAPDPRPPVPPASPPQVVAEVRGATPAKVAGRTPEGPASASASRDKANGEGILHESETISEGPHTHGQPDSSDANSTNKKKARDNVFQAQ